MLRILRTLRSVAEFVPKNWNASPPCSGGGSSVTMNFRSLERAVARSDAEKEKRSIFALPQLDYDVSHGISPLFSKKQFDIQYHMFHRDAVDRLNAHTIGSELEGHNLDVVIRETAFDATRAVIASSASEHFNYCFWYKSLRPWGTSVPTGLRDALQLLLDRGPWSDPIDEVQRLMTVTVLSQQESCGWVYLVWTGTSFEVLHFAHGSSPIANDLVPLLCINIHESAFRIDYDSNGTSGLEQYIRNYFKTCNWIVADRNYSAAVQKG